MEAGGDKSCECGEVGWEGGERGVVEKQGGGCWGEVGRLGEEDGEEEEEVEKGRGEVGKLGLGGGWLLWFGPAGERGDGFGFGCGGGDD